MLLNRQAWTLALTST